MQENTRKSIQSVPKSHRIVKALLDTGGAGVSELSEEVDLHPSTVHAHLASLIDCGLVVKDGTEYEASLRFLELGGRLRNDEPLYRRGRKELEKFAKETGEMANMAVREETDLVVLHMVEGEKAVEKQTPIGKRNPLHCTGMGKAILAELSKEEVDAIVDEVGLPKRTPETITTRDELFDELKTIRRQGYALDAEELHEGIHCIATSIKTDDELVGAISITGPTSRFTDEEYQENLRDSLLQTANIIKLNLKFHR